MNHSNSSLPYLETEELNLTTEWKNCCNISRGRVFQIRAKYPKLRPKNLNSKRRTSNKKCVIPLNTVYRKKNTKPPDVYIRGNNYIKRKLKNVVIRNKWEGVMRLAEFGYSFINFHFEF